jgi:Zn-dependent protease
MNFIERFALWVIPVIFAIVIHEIAHGWTALRLGDTTAKALGRLSFNPLKHIDPVGSLLVPGLMLLLPGGFLFGWAKPVPINPARLNNPRRDMIIVALAGPFANLMMLLFWAFFFKIGLLLDGGERLTGFVMMHMGAAGLFINTILMMFNLLPLPPLDGSRVVEGFLPASLAIKYNQLSRFGFPLLMILVFTGALGKVLWPMLNIGLQGGAYAAALPFDVLSAVYSNLFP